MILSLMFYHTSSLLICHTELHMEKLISVVKDENKPESAEQAGWEELTKNKHNPLGLFPWS